MDLISLDDWPAPAKACAQRAHIKDGYWAAKGQKPFLSCRFILPLALPQLAKVVQVPCLGSEVLRARYRSGCKPEYAAEYPRA